MHNADASNDLQALASDKPALYRELNSQLRSLINDEPDRIANLANASALLFSALPRLNWAGFYLLKEGELVVGPFQGKPACVRIPVGKGVCGTAALQRRVIIVKDVHAFDGHIACDSASASEIVLPIISSAGELLGVLDLDSPDPARFDEQDRDGLERFVATLLQTM